MATKLPIPIEVELPELDYGLAAHEQCDVRERQLREALAALKAAEAKIAEAEQAGIRKALEAVQGIRPHGYMNYLSRVATTPMRKYCAAINDSEQAITRLLTTPQTLQAPQNEETRR